MISDMISGRAASEQYECRDDHREHQKGARIFTEVLKDQKVGCTIANAGLTFELRSTRKYSWMRASLRRSARSLGNAG